MGKYLFTKEQIQRIKDSGAEPDIIRVHVAQFKRNTTREMNDVVADVYEETTSEKVNRNWGCAYCTYKVYEQAGNIYFDSIEHYKKEEATLPTEEPKKRGRKKKEEATENNNNEEIKVEENESK